MNNNYRFLIDNYLYNLNSEESSRIRSFIKESFTDSDRNLASTSECDYYKFVKAGLYSSVEKVKEKVNLIIDKFIYLNSEMQKLNKPPLFNDPTNVILSFIFRDILVELYQENISFDIQAKKDIIYKELKESLACNKVKSQTLKNIVGHETYFSLLDKYVNKIEGVYLNKLGEMEIKEYFNNVITSLEGEDDFTTTKYGISFSIYNSENLEKKNALITLYKQAYNFNRVALYLLGVLHHNDLPSDSDNEYLQEIIKGTTLKVTDFSKVCLNNTSISGKFLNMSAELDFAPANHKIAFLLTAVIDVELVDKEKLLYHYQKAVDQNYLPSINNLAIIYITGKYKVPINFEKGLNMLFKATEKGYEKSRINLAWLFVNNVDAKYYDILFPYLVEASNKVGDIYLKELGNAYFYGKGTNIDYEKAIFYLDKYYSNIVVKNYSSSLEKYGVTKLEKYQGAYYYYLFNKTTYDSTLKLAVMNFYGLGVKRNYSDAIKYFNEYLENNSSYTALTFLAKIYSEGLGVSVDLTLSKKYLSRAKRIKNIYS